MQSEKQLFYLAGQLHPEVLAPNIGEIIFPEVDQSTKFQADDKWG